MKIYLAGRPEDHQQLNSYAEQLETDGFQVVSSWHSNDAAAGLVAASRRQKQAQHDLVANLMRQAITGPELNLPADSDYKALGGPPIFEMQSALDRFRPEIDSAIA